MLKKNLITVTVFVMIALAAAVALTPAPIPSAQAATPNLAISNPGVMLIPLHLSGQYTTTTASVASFNMPQPCDMIGVGTRARTFANTGGVTIDVLSGGVSILSAVIPMTTASYAEGTISTAAIPDENAITVNLGALNGSMTVNDITVLMTCVRK